jgi:hypothetical protein
LANPTNALFANVVAGLLINLRKFDSSNITAAEIDVGSEAWRTALISSIQPAAVPEPSMFAVFATLEIAAIAYGRLRHASGVSRIARSRSASTGGRVGEPALVDESHADQVAHVRSDLVAIRHQLHVDQSLERDDSKTCGIVDGRQRRCGQAMLGSNLFAGKEQVDRLAGLGVRAVEENVTPRTSERTKPACSSAAVRTVKSSRRTSKSMSRVLRTAPSSTVVTQEATAWPPTTA